MAVCLVGCWLVWLVCGGGCKNTKQNNNNFVKEFSVDRMNMKKCCNNSVKNFYKISGEIEQHGERMREKA